jgi:hypothetical protein
MSELHSSYSRKTFDVLSMDGSVRPGAFIVFCTIRVRLLEMQDMTTNCDTVNMEALNQPSDSSRRTP